MLPEITLRLAICANACLEERDQAEADMRRVREYVERNQNTMKGKK